MVLAEINFKHNLKEWNELNYTDIIYNQGQYSNFKYGLGDVARNGCGAIAVYNILILEDNYKPFPQIIKYFDRGNQNFFGILGTSPFGIMNYMKKEGYKVNIYLKSGDFKNAAIISKYSILMYFNLEYGHFELLYNYDNDYFSINPRQKVNFDNLLESKKHFFKLLITIN